MNSTCKTDKETNSLTGNSNKLEMSIVNISKKCLLLFIFYKYKTHSIWFQLFYFKYSFRIEFNIYNRYIYNIIYNKYI